MTGGAIAADRVLKDGATAVVGPTTSTVSGTTATLLNVRKMPQVGITATSPTLSNPVSYPYFARPIPTDDVVSYAIIASMASVGWSRVGVLAMDDSYGTFFSQSLINLAPGFGMTLVPISYTARLQTSIDEALNKLAEAKVYVVFSLMFGEDVPGILLGAAARGMVGEGHTWMVADIDPSQALRSLPPEQRASLNLHLRGMLRMFAAGADLPGTTWGVLEAVFSMGRDSPLTASMPAAMQALVDANPTFWDEGLAGIDYAGTAVPWAAVPPACPPCRSHSTPSRRRDSPSGGNWPPSPPRSLAPAIPRASRGTSSPPQGTRTMRCTAPCWRWAT